MPALRPIFILTLLAGIALCYLPQATAIAGIWLEPAPTDLQPGEYANKTSVFKNGKLEVTVWADRFLVRTLLHDEFQGVVRDFPSR